MKIDAELLISCEGREGDKHRFVFMLARNLPYGTHHISIVAVAPGDANTKVFIKGRSYNTKVMNSISYSFTGTGFVLKMNMIPTCLDVIVDGMGIERIPECELKKLAIKSNLRCLLDTLISEHPTRLQYKNESNR